MNRVKNSLLKIFLSLSIVLTILITSYKCAEDHEPIHAYFGLYMSMDSVLTQEKISTMNLSDFRLEKWLTNDMIEYYDFSSHMIYLKVNKKSFFPEYQWFIGPEYSDYRKYWQKYRNFIAVADDKRIYIGEMGQCGSYKPIAKISSLEAAFIADDIIGITFYNELIVNYRYNLARDSRNSEEIKNALKISGIYSGGLEYKVDDIKMYGQDTLEVTAIIKNIDRNNLYVFNLLNGVKSKPIFILCNKNNATGYDFYFSKIISSDFSNNLDDYYRLDKDKSIRFKCIAVSNKKVSDNDYYFYSDFYGERVNIQMDKRIKSDGRIWVGTLRSNYFDITYSSANGITVKTKDFRF